MPTSLQVMPLAWAAPELNAARLPEKVPADRYFQPPSGNSATIVRTSDGGKQYAVRLKDLIKRGDVSANVEVKPGDILVIPQSLF